MSQSRESRNKALVVKAFDTLSIANSARDRVGTLQRIREGMGNNRRREPASLPHHAAANSGQYAPLNPDPPTIAS
jgi:hypothetical protein